MKKSSANWKNIFFQLGDFFSSAKVIIFMNNYS